MDNQGTIVLLYGTSTSGKTTLSQCLKNDWELENSVPLHIEGTDLAFKRYVDYNQENLKNLIDSDKKNNELFQSAQALLNSDEIYQAILTEKLQLYGQEFALLIDENNQTFESELSRFVDSTVPLENHSMVRVIIGSIRQLIIRLFDRIFIIAHEKMLDQAIQNSIQGIITILDVVPHPGYDGQFMIDLFEQHLLARQYHGKQLVLLLHCPIPLLAQRMKDRTQKALLNNDNENLRQKPFPFRQYAKLFEMTNLKAEVLGHLTQQDAYQAIEPFCTNPLELQQILLKIGFTEKIVEISLSAKCKVDKVYDTQTQTAAEIADKITRLIKSVP